jgi:hypothetical protein
MGAMHGQNLLAAKDARIRQLEERLEGMREAGDQLGKTFKVVISTLPKTT